MKLRALAISLLLLCVARAEQPNPAPAKATPESRATVIVFNENDPDSAALARYYTLRRGVPNDHVIGLKCSVQEEISRAEFDHDIAEPLREAFGKKGWWKLTDESDARGRVSQSKIRFVALMRGIPLKIAPTTEPYDGDSREGPPQVMAHNEASVDSELAVLGVYTRRISGGLSNPYFRSYQRMLDAGVPSLLLVCRLDAPTPELVRRMIDDSLAAERTSLRGFAYIDARGTLDPQLVEGDKWLLNAAVTARRKGMPVIMDSGAGLYPDSYPMNYAAIYLGWYAENVTGPFVRPDFHFVPGAVAVHLHSFSGVSLRDPKRNWCAPLIAAGAAATLGNVYEPYLGFTPNLDVFHDRLRAGFTFAESGYMSVRLLSWMTTFVGDPLYRPFPEPSSMENEAPDDEWAGYRTGAQAWFDRGPEAGAAELKRQADRFNSGVIYEGLGLLWLTVDRSKDAQAAFEEAAKRYREPQDILRATLHQVFQLRALKRTKDALALAQKRVKQFPTAPGAEALRGLAVQLQESLAAKP